MTVHANGSSRGPRVWRAAGQRDRPVERGGRRVELTARSVVAAALVIAAALVTLWAARRSSRILGWVAAAAVIAGLLAPVVDRLAARIRRGLATLVVAVTVLGVVGGVAWLVIGDLQDQYGRLRELAPEAAAAAERSSRFGEAARRFELTRRVETYLADLPGRLGGGQGAEAVRSAATRGIALLVTIVLALFLMVDGQRLVRAGLRQVRDDDHRRRISVALFRGYRRAWSYLAMMIAKALVGGAVAYAGYRLAGLPAASVLAVTVALASFVPDLGIAAVGIPIALLGGGLEGSLRWGVLIAAGHVVVQWADAWILRRVVHRRSLVVGPVASLIAVVFGMDVYGLGGVLVALPLVTLALAVLDEWLPEDQVPPLEEAVAPRAVLP
jgi:predicted PurR-regulated permease PerM